ncbi:hypothetical protein HanPSC8_Chr01g0018171 [Helianthus annuus]|nr:hypothetical protein HanPSC8_Chr01g0018171 [Helianthus annuus]
MALPNQAFGEQVLAAAGMSDRRLHDSENVSVLLLEGEGKSLCSITSFFKKFLKIISSDANSLFFNTEVAFYHRAFPAHAGVMGVRPLRTGEEYWSEQIQPNFMYARAELFAAPPVATEGAHISNPRPCRAITPAGKEVVYLSSEESVVSSEHELNPPHDVFASVLRNLRIDHEDKKPKRVIKKKVTVAEGVAHKKPEVTSAASDVASRNGTARFRQRSLDDFVYVANSFEELFVIDGNPQGSVGAGARSSGSTGSKDLPSDTTPTSTPAKETEVDLGHVELIRKNASKRPREETKSEAAPRSQKACHYQACYWEEREPQDSLY